MSSEPAAAPPESGASTSSTTPPPYDRWTLRHESEVDYGYLSRTRGEGIDEVTAASTEGNSSPSKQRFYITTAINYTNGPAHMGHAYEATTTDVLARYHRLKGDATFFLTGTDEHGQKIANTARDLGREPIEVCDLYATGFQVLNQRILISNDDYLRTTSERHKRTAKQLWNLCAARDDVYLDTYEGWYNVKEETYVTDSEAQLLNYLCPNSGQPLKRVEEASYFFRMSKYRDQLLEHIRSHPEFIQPESHRNQILTRLQTDELRDLSISRTNFSWGIPVPDGFDSSHVLYVWMDALTNYLTGVNGLGVNGDDPANVVGPGLSKFWPADVHIIGKDILWFHAVIWPCLLMSAGVELPRTVFAHGFVNDKDGKKMSKSLGNVVDPHDMLDKFHVDTFRWYLCKEAPYGGELAFSEDSMRDMHNADLCDTLGNLVHRATNLCAKYCGGVVPDVPLPDRPPTDFAGLVESYRDKMDRFELQGGASVAMQGLREVNGYLQDSAPWAMKGDDPAVVQAQQVVVRAALESIYALGHLLLPFIPVGASKIFKKLGTEPTQLASLDPSCRNLKVGTKIEVGDVLYSKSLSDTEVQDAKIAAQKKKKSLAEAQARKKEAKAKNAAKASVGQQQGGGTDKEQPDFTKMDIRVGRIVKVWNHPDADKLFCEEIDVGEDSGPRSIASGLRNYYSLEEMHNRMVLVVCNLKSSKMVGFESQGMVLAAKNEDGSKVELVAPPAGSVVGERVVVQGLAGEPYSSTQVKKKKVWEAVAKDLVTADGGIATWQGASLETSAGPCYVPTLIGAPIS